MQNGVLTTRIASLYWSQPSSVIFACKTETLGTALQVCVGPRPHLWICAFTTAYLLPDILVSMGPRPHLWIFANNTACLVPKLQALWVPELTCGFVHAKQRAEHQNYKSQREPAHMCCFCIQKWDFRTRITSLYGSKTSSVDLCKQNCFLST